MSEILCGYVPWKDRHDPTERGYRGMVRVVGNNGTTIFTRKCVDLRISPKKAIEDALAYARAYKINNKRKDYYHVRQYFFTN